MIVFAHTKFSLVRIQGSEVNPIQYGGGGALWPPYSFSLISPE